MTVGTVTCETVGGDATVVGWKFEEDVSAWYVSFGASEKCDNRRVRARKMSFIRVHEPHEVIE